MALCLEEDRIKCSVCLELYKDPRVLPCLHSYCLVCIQRLVSTTSDTIITISCPQCRAKHTVPIGGVVTYPVDVSIFSEVEVAKIKEGTRKVVCGLCTTGDVAVSYCSDCGEHLCEFCKNNHTRFKLYSSHCVKSLDDPLAANLSTDFLLKQPSFCVHHPKYELEIFCSDCSILVCYKCMLQETHKRHKYVLIENELETVIGTTYALMDDADSKEPVFQAYLEIIQNIEKLVVAKQDEYRMRIKEIMEKVEDMFTQDNKKIWATKDYVEVMLAQMKSCHSFYDRIEQQINDGQTLSLINQLLLCLNQIDKATVNIEEFSCIKTTSTEFEKSMFDTFRSMSSALDKDISKTLIMSVGEKGSTPATGTRCSINYYYSGYYKTTVIVTLTQSIAQTIQWDCSVTTPPSYYSSQTKSCTVVPVADNQLQIEFTPNASGSYVFHLFPPKTETILMFTITCKR